MALIYITGNAGVGKTTVCRGLQKRGYEAHDIDKNGITGWYDRQSGEKVEHPRSDSGRTKEWFAQNAFKMVPKRIEKFAKLAKSKNIFLCGQSIHDHEIWYLFDKIIYLQASKEIIKNRLMTRTENVFGKTPSELEHILAIHNPFQEKHKDHGAIMVDATQPLDKVVDKILSIC